MTREAWYDSDSPRRWFFGVWGWAVAIIAAGLITGVLLVALGTVTAPWAGRAGAYRQQQSSTNRIFGQQQFRDLYTDYQATVAKLPVYKAEAASSFQAQTNYTGLLSHCLDVVGQYNAAASKYLTAQFRDADLPASLTSSECNQ